MRVSHLSAIILSLICLCLPACHKTHEEQSEGEHHKIVVTTPYVKDVDVTQEYVCLIHSQNYIKVCALANGYLEPITIKEGQAVKKNDVLFKILPILYEAKLAKAKAKAQLARQELQNQERLRDDPLKIVSENQVLLFKAKLEAEEAEVQLAQAELNFTTVKAPFAGIIDRLHEQQGSLIKEGEVLTTLSDNSTMWVYFNVPEARYQEYKATPVQEKEEQRIELVLANGSKFQHDGKVIPGKMAAILARFNNETGNGTFRADFPNPDGLLRHGMTGKILIHRTVKNAILIPQRATFETLDKQYVFVVDKEGVVKQREIFVQNEMEDTFVIRKGLSAGDKIIFEGVRQVRDGDKVEYEVRPPEQILANQRYHAE